MHIHLLYGQAPYFPELASYQAAQGAIDAVVPLEMLQSIRFSKNRSINFYEQVYVCCIIAVSS